MRLDIFLKLSRLIPRRTVAQQRCESGAVLVNGARAKSSREVREGDEIALRHRGRVLTVTVVRVPLKPPPASAASSLYQVLSDKEDAKSDKDSLRPPGIPELDLIGGISDES